MATSQNSWLALSAGDHRLHTWVIPAKTGTVKYTLRNGSAGFILAWFLLWFAEVVQPLKGKVLDDWGFAERLVRGSATDLSNHASGTAADMNALLHPLARVGTFQRTQVDAIHKKLRQASGCIRWGGDYHGRKDEMHVEIVQNITYCEKTAKRLMWTSRGRRILAANPGQREVILS